MRKLLGALCLTVILVGSLSVYKTWREIRNRELLADIISPKFSTAECLKPGMYFLKPGIHFASKPFFGHCQISQDGYVSSTLADATQFQNITCSESVDH